ncbi:MAG TPA: M48 family peptidase [Rhodospirillaceae bacterium]|nr:M48 family peptidase [Rhodospirillaceae bacterium]
MTRLRVRDIDFRLHRAGPRKTADIVIERDGQINLIAPEHLTDEEANAVVERRRMWIYKNLAEWRDLNASRVVREWVNGEGFLYLGSSYRLLLVSTPDAPVALKEGRFCLDRKIVDDGGEDAARRAFEAFYAEKGQERISRRVAYFAPKVGVNVSGVTVKDLGYRWASCSKSGALSFHWKCMMARPKVLDYIIVHELCHLLVRDHSDAFWNEVDKILPDYRERKNWLRDCGAGLDL